MNLNKKFFLGSLLLSLMLFNSGCALLQIPVELVKAPFVLLRELLKFADKLPMPPPGVFF